MSRENCPKCHKLMNGPVCAWCGFDWESVPADYKPPGMTRRKWIGVGIAIAIVVILVNLFD